MLIYFLPWSSIEESDYAKRIARRGAMEKMDEDSEEAATIVITVSNNHTMTRMDPISRQPAKRPARDISICFIWGNRSQRIPSEEAHLGAGILSPHNRNHRALFVVMPMISASARNRKHLPVRKMATPA
jgi:hypothetical protein